MLRYRIIINHENHNVFGESAWGRCQVLAVNASSGGLAAWFQGYSVQ